MPLDLRALVYAFLQNNIFHQPALRFCLSICHYLIPTPFSNRSFDPIHLNYLTVALLTFLQKMFIALARAVKRKRRSSRPPCQHQVRSQGTTGVALESTDESRSEEPSSTPVTKEADPAEHGQDQFGPERCEICKKTKHDARVYRWKLIIGLLLPYLLASLDLTVVATALPFIASHFQKLDQLNWIVTSYTLTSTAFIPCFGQLADVFGRHPCLQLSMFLMLMGSTLCAAAQTWGMLLFGRAVQGISAAGIMNLIQIVLSDKVSLKENAKNNTIFSFIAGISYSIGPIIGG